MGQNQRVRRQKGLPVNTAVITGASSGLGRGFAEFIDASCAQVEEIWLIARREERLNEIASSLVKKTRVFALDLTQASSIGTIKNALSESNAHVSLFIGAAGYGKIGSSRSVSDEDTAGMIDLNCKAAVLCTRAVIPYMHAGDRIIEICSTSAFQPLQYLNVYAASKAFIYNYTRALRNELLPKGIAVTAVCPYWIKDTEFIGMAQNDGEDGRAAGVRSFPLSTTAAKVVKRAMAASGAGFAVCTPDIVSFFHRIFAKILPRTVMLYIWELLRR